MKKLSVVLLAMVFAFAMGSTAQAVNLVEVKTTSDPIQLYPCEKSGSITFEFDDGSVLTAGDWWVVDLPFGVTLCSDIDYEISLGCNRAILGAGNTSSFTRGPITLNVGANGTPTGMGTGIFFRVVGASGQQRVTISVHAGRPTVFVPTPAVGSFVVPTGDDVEEQGTLEIKLFDSLTHPGFIWEFVTVCYIDPIEPIDNTMCIDARAITGNTVNVSYDSRIDKFTFTGDNEVAHRIPPPDIACVGCKLGLVGDVPIQGGQGALCLFDYETPGAAGGYCPAYTGNRLIIQNNTGTFATGAAQAFALTAEIVAPTDGVYFGGAMTVIGANSATVDLTACPTGAGANPNIPPAGVVGLGVGTGWLTSAMTTAATYDAGTCAVPAASQGVYQSTTGPLGTTVMAGLNTINQIWVAFAPFAYQGTIAAGTTVTVEISLIELPCTTIHTCTVDVGVFVVDCAAAVAPYMFTFPYYPAINDAIWWSGAALSNCGGADDCTLTFYEQDGDIGTYDVSIAAGGLWFTLWTTILGDIVADAGNAGSLGDSPFFVCVNCDDTSGTGTVRGFGMLGDGNQAQGTAAGPACP
jgi:hypothetical protein